MFTRPSNTIHSAGSGFVLLLLAGFALDLAQLHAADEEPVPAKSTEDATAQSGDNTDVDDLTTLSIEELMNVQVTSVTRSKGQSLFTAPAAIHVVTEEDIRRTGHQHLPELMRLVPGMHVGRVTANKWAVAARGFNGRFNHLQLVQMDGRTMYSPVFAGVLWGGKDTLLEDLERIEVIRGPGATLWGANAVNGIVNFKTKNSKDTQGLLVTGVGGTEERAMGGVRYGGKINENLHWRIYGKHVQHDHFEDEGPSFTDDWRRSQGGFRFDWEEGANKVTWQGDAYRGKLGTTIFRPDFTTGTQVDVDDDEIQKGHNFLARWTHTFGENNEMEFQGYYDSETIVLPHDGVHFRQQIDTFDLDFQHSIAVGKRQKIVWGFNYRLIDSDTENSSGIMFDPTGNLRDTISGFFQDTISIIDGKLSITLGTKVEHNDYTFFEYQPSARVVFTPQKRHSLWWAVSRAVHVPSISDNDVTFVQAVAPGVQLLNVPNRHLDSEEVIAFEMGYRAKPVDWFSLDLTAFHNRYDNLIFRGMDSPFPPVISPHNSGTAKSYGFEASVNWSIGERLRFSANYSYLDVQANSRIGVGDGPEGLEHTSPTNMFHLRSYFDITSDIELNTAVYYHDTVSTRNVHRYWRGDVGVTWRPPVDNLEISLWGTNLFDESHKEYGPDDISNGFSRIQRGFFGKVTWKF